MQNNSIRIALCGLGLALLGALAVPDPGLAQTSRQTAPAGLELERQVTYFYRQGNTANVSNLLSQWVAMGGPGPQIVGFAAGLTAKYPDKIDQMFPPTLEERAQRIAILGVRVGVSPDRAKKLARRLGLPESQMSQIDVGATLDETRITAPQAQDMFWGASFATGDPRYPRRILDHYASIANRADIDIKQVMALIRGIPGYSPGILKTVKEKEGDQKVRDLVLAASALWSLESNAARHDFVRTVVNAYVASNPNTPAASGLRQVAEAAQIERRKRLAPQRQ